MFTSRYDEVATHLGRIAATASTQAEANHWWDESDRFADLADLARTDSEEARRRYRPTVAYQATT